jgi:hypothetical protein
MESLLLHGGPDKSSRGEKNFVRADDSKKVRRCFPYYFTNTLIVFSFRPFKVIDSSVESLTFCECIYDRKKIRFGGQI